MDDLAADPGKTLDGPHPHLQRPASQHSLIPIQPRPVLPGSETLIMTEMPFLQSGSGAPHQPHSQHHHAHPHLRHLHPSATRSSSSGASSMTPIEDSMSNAASSASPSPVDGLSDPRKKFSCQWDSCSARFKRLAELKRHERTHTKDKPHVCSWPGCGSRFGEKYGLKVHYRTHTGEKPYKCPKETCQARFSDSSALARHRRTVHRNDLPQKGSASKTSPGDEKLEGIPFPTDAETYYHPASVSIAPPGPLFNRHGMMMPYQSNPAFMGYPYGPPPISGSTGLSSRSYSVSALAGPRPPLDHSALAPPHILMHDRTVSAPLHSAIHIPNDTSIPGFLQTNGPRHPSVPSVFPSSQSMYPFYAPPDPMPQPHPTITAYAAPPSEYPSYPPNPAARALVHSAPASVFPTFSLDPIPRPPTDYSLSTGPMPLMAPAVQSSLSSSASGFTSVTGAILSTVSAHSPAASAGYASMTGSISSLSSASAFSATSSFTSLPDGVTSVMPAVSSIGPLSDFSALKPGAPPLVPKLSSMSGLASLNSVAASPPQLPWSSTERTELLSPTDAVLPLPMYSSHPSSLFNSHQGQSITTLVPTPSFRETSNQGELCRFGDGQQS